MYKATMLLGIMMLMCLVVSSIADDSANEEQFSTDPAVCSLEKERGPCRAGFRRFYYDSKTKECELFLYGGCSGNFNRFKTKEDCEAVCIKA